jgi:LIVCS family branched-chain amino acid:cation transporter
MKRYTHIFIYGFAIFSMFFGSGNLVFPLEIGQLAGSHWLSGFFGLFITGIFLPFLGLFVIKLHKGSYTSFFGEAGRIAQVALPFFTLSLLGSFGVVPRCITVAHGGMQYIFPEFSLEVFSFIFCLICFAVCLRENFLIAVLGKWMTPLLLLCLAVLLLLGITQAPSLPASGEALAAFKNGFLTGYHTLDLFAAFFFSALIFNQIQARLQTRNDKEVLWAALKPSFVGSALLSIVYLGFVFLGAHYKDVTINVSPELILPTIASHLMGEKAVFLIGVIVLFSCLTTAVALNNIYAQYLCGVFSLKKNKFPLILLGTTSLSFMISLMDFQGIARILGPLLEVSYPGIIALTMLSILFKGHLKVKTFLFYGVLALSLGWRCI